MKKLWLTYAWKDNEETEVDNLIVDLKRKGLDVYFDRRQLIPGQRIWAQLEKAISDPDQSDGWAIFATRNSLESEPCQEELAYALDRALRTRGSTFPLIGIFPEPLERQLIPSAIATRLYVDLRDPAWADQIAQGLAGTRIGPDLTDTVPFVAKCHGALKLELRPKAGRWFPFYVAVPTNQFSALGTIIMGPKGHMQDSGLSSYSEINSADGKMKGYAINSGAADTMNSAYLSLKSIPDVIEFGGKENMFRLSKLDLEKLGL